MKTNLIRSIAAIFAVVIISASASSQNISISNGLYYSESGAPYSGAYTAYYDSGTKKSTFVIAEGKVQGAVTYFYENGNVMETGFYLNNEKNRDLSGFKESG